ncbi:phage baseplate assembly protein [Oricola thermophila]|uniref:Phage tail protein n=1 Tax=Oricola thermophila TaxID=2742145 RepID=A0A6N1VMM1_9HYPH|nr:hypothetical protein [Oricola thermophila]QKV20237.1 hypothetical protein HTY61_18160 [Oricola thermophila]
MTTETVTFTVNGRPLQHTRAALSASAEQVVRMATFSVAWTGGGLPCIPDEPAEIAVSGELWGTGYVRDVRGRHGANNRDYEVTWVSRTCDATECSIDHPTGLKRDADLADIAREFDTLGIGIEADGVATLVKSVHKIRPGETLFETIERDARAQGVLVYDTPRGRLKLAAKAEGRHAGRLARGINILQASGSLSGARNFSSVKVRGQASVGTTGAALRPEGVARGTASRARPLILTLEGEATSDRLKRRADWEARRASGQGVSCTVDVPGFRDSAGRIWSPNWLVAIDDDWLGIAQDMVIASASLEQDVMSGTIARLTLKDPRALGGENPRGQSNTAWASPETLEPDYREG